ncbi:MAG: DoxX family protein [Alphaproteobacteria bacterium]|nr:DoxX family protein [Rhodospirillales bacterium]MCW9045579.1 DoxX family protein [Alphaproteobacteria bacterium]
MKIINTLENLYDLVFSTLQRVAGEWFLGLTARLVFSSVLLMFFVSSARTKVGNGFPDFLIPGSGAYAQILPPIAEANNYDISQIAFIPYGIIVLMGTYSEVLIPVLILIGLFTRAASLAMIGFIVVMTFVDIQFHGIDAEAIGSFFDRIHNSAVSDQRLLWIFPLIYLALNGGGTISVDNLLKRFSTR